VGGDGGGDEAGAGSVRIEPAGLVVHPGPGETVMAAARRAGLYWPTICGGISDCGVCRCEVVEGVEHTEPAGEPEERFLTRLGARREAAHVRLACLLRLTDTPAGGHVVVRKPGVRLR
jgi:ferredoxin, 2Fe-2S